MLRSCAVKKHGSGWLTLLVGAGVAVIASFNPVTAATLVTDRAELGANDLLDWSTVAPPFTFLPSSFGATSAGGLGVGVSVPAPVPGVSQPFIFQNGPAIPTNFGDGDFVLFTGLNFATQAGNPGPLTLTFTTPVFGVGAQLLPDNSGTFTGFLAAFDRDDALIGTFQLDGFVTTNRDNTAIFLGVKSDTANIARLVYSTSIPGVAIGVNQLSILAIPEPPPLPALLLLSIAAFAWRSRYCDA